MLLEFDVLLIGEEASVMLENEGIRWITIWASFGFLNFSLLDFDIGKLLALVTNKGSNLHFWVDLRGSYDYS